MGFNTGIGVFNAPYTIPNGVQQGVPLAGYGGGVGNATASQNAARAVAQPTPQPSQPAASPANSVGGGSGGSVYNAAAAAKAAADAKNLAYINDQVTGAQAGEMNSGSVAGSTYNTQGLNLVDQLRQGQTGINQARKSIGMDQINSIKSLADEIKQGLQGGAVTLANSNALDSSAANAVDRIYANYGNTQRNVINNEAAVKNDQQDTAQSNLDLQRNEGVRNLQTYRDTVLDQIGNDTTQKLAAIDGIASLQGLQGKVDVNGIKNAVIANAQQKIADADAYIQSQLKGVAPMTPDEIATQAYELANKGVQSSGSGLTYQTLPTNPTQNLGGAPNSQLPLYLKPKTS